ncbi:MAG TPA: hypothetical protein PLM93_01040 [Sulfuricurvum sp.]|nr:MAG: hypothetical protein B7Y30_04970 [Campylobacterales bacterium 16-40-21]OZA03731.1 MAG: hypothetical protein B7X89_03410 [Sulfuricurvum sp. 17-40-25]HQS65754.1 hypothetical protein [Sulfuricurvum sp.]HQT36403.1 hypothetical protein [Sulfuricurvum sp.]
MKELTKSDLMVAFEQDIKMALYTLDRYHIEANLALVACDEYDIDKANLIDSVRQSDVAKRVNDHYIAVLFTFVDHIGARCALEKLVNQYKEYNLKGSLIALKKGETIESVCERMLEANRIIHDDVNNTIFDDSELL